MMPNRNKYLKISLTLFAISFILLIATYFVCLLPAWGYEDGSGQSGEVAYQIIGVITVAGLLLNPVLGNIIPAFIVHLIDIVLLSLAISIVINFIQQLYKNWRSS